MSNGNPTIAAPILPNQPISYNFTGPMAPSNGNWIYTITAYYPDVSTGTVVGGSTVQVVGGRAVGANIQCMFGDNISPPASIECTYAYSPAGLEQGAPHPGKP